MCRMSLKITILATLATLIPAAAASASWSF
jgi:hypothetical protein